MDIGEAAEMVAKNGRDFVSLPEEESFALSFVARNWGLWLVNGYALARFGNCFDLVGLCLGSPRLLPWLLGRRLALRNSASGESLWDFPSSCHDVDVCEWQMSKAVMPV